MAGGPAQTADGVRQDGLRALPRLLGAQAQYRRHDEEGGHQPGHPGHRRREGVGEARPSRRAVTAAAVSGALRPTIAADRSS